MIVDVTGEYKDDGQHLNNIISDLSATSQELEATLNETFNTINDISATVEESTSATTGIAEKNFAMVDTLNYSHLRLNLRGGRFLETLLQ